MKTKTDELMTEVGYISMFFSNFDYLLNEINCSLINLENKSIGMLISSKLTTHSRMEMYQKLLKMIGFPKLLVDQANEIISEFSKIKKQRNEFIHGIWHTREEDFAIDDFYIRDISALDWNDAKKIDIKELKKIKGDLLGLLKKQLELNIELLETYRKILKDNSKHKRKAYLAIKKAMEGLEIVD